MCMHACAVHSHPSTLTRSPTFTTSMPCFVLIFGMMSQRSSRHGPPTPRSLCTALQDRWPRTTGGACHATLASPPRFTTESDSSFLCENSDLVHLHGQVKSLSKSVPPMTEPTMASHAVWLHDEEMSNNDAGGTHAPHIVHVATSVNDSRYAAACMNQLRQT
jgi:hypothetical protein